MIKRDKSVLDLTIDCLTTGDLFRLTDSSYYRVVYIMGRDRIATPLSGDDSGVTIKVAGNKRCTKVNYELVEV